MARYKQTHTQTDSHCELLSPLALWAGGEKIKVFWNHWIICISKNFAKRETSLLVFLVTGPFCLDGDLNVGGCRSGAKDSKNI